MKTLVWEPVYICQGRGDYEPMGRYRHEVAFDGKCIYILGGGTAEEVYDFLDIPMFDLERREWHKRRTKRDTRGKYFHLLNYFEFVLKLTSWSILLKFFA